MPARRRCAAQKYLSITHLLRGPGRERIGSYQKTIIRSGRTFDAGGEDGFHLISSAGVAHKQMILEAEQYRGLSGPYAAN